MQTITNTGHLPKLIAELDRAKKRGGKVTITSACGSTVLQPAEVILHLDLIRDLAEMARRLRRRSIVAGIKRAQKSHPVQRGHLGPVEFTDAARRFSAGDNVRNIADAYGVNPGALRRRLNRSGCRRNPK